MHRFAVATIFAFAVTVKVCHAAPQHAALDAILHSVTSNINGNRVGGLVFGPAPCVTCDRRAPSEVPPTPCANCGSSETIAYQPPEQTYRPPPMVWQPPVQTFQPPPIDYSPPAQTMTPNAVQLSVPAQTYQPPPYTWQPPAIIWQPPPQTFQPPAQTFHPPPVTFQPPPQSYQPPVVSVPLPAQHYQPPVQTMSPPLQTIPIPPQTIIFPIQMITVPELTPPTAECQNCPCYWCRAQFGSWERSSARKIADAGEQIDWSAVAMRGNNTNITSEPYFVDIINKNETAKPHQEVNSTKSACSIFIKHFSMDGPLKADKLVDFVNKTFYGENQVNNTALVTKYAKGIEPSTFHCCHNKYGREYFPSGISNDTAYVHPLLPSGQTCMKLISKLYNDLSAIAGSVKSRNETQTARAKH